MTIDTLRDKARDAAAVLGQKIVNAATDLAQLTERANAEIADLTAQRDAHIAAANSLDILDPATKAILDGLTGEAPAVATEPEPAPEPTEEPQ